MQHGLHNRRARNTAMIHAVTDLPPVVVADLFGVHITTTFSWAALASTSWTDYLAATAPR
ncbi:hypothetical protein [Saccharopolyspora sp. ASAGF58]|uniref:hypothetical protein n=1 Tax=Saccharopolyspora sp. ASAGF58 TaxID=2719023 RepID=UPI001B30049D|nr:hypothetical protein [Saccharopolyspora sp. ASAGF58]